MNDFEFNRRYTELLAQETLEPERWFWLSFVGESGRNIGCAIVEGRGILTAVRQAHKLGINPGGEVLAKPFDDPSGTLPDEQYRNRLLTREEALELVAMIDAR